jgi:hypothetical protein
MTNSHIRVLFALMLFGGLMTIHHAEANAPPLVTCDLTPLCPQEVPRRQAWDELQAVAALQGLVNRHGPRLYVFLVGDGAKIDHYWLDTLRTKGQWLAGRPLDPVSDVRALLQRFRGDYQGAVVWDDHVPATSNVAETVAGADGLLPLRYDPDPHSLYSWCVLDPQGLRLSVKVRLIHPDGSSLFTGHGLVPGTTLASTGSAKCDATLWAVEHYLKAGRCDPTHLAYYPDAYWLGGKPSDVPAVRTLLSDHDYFVAHRGFFFDLSPWDDEAPNDDPSQPLGADARTLNAVLRAAYDQTAQRRQGRPGVIQVGGFTPWDQKYTDHTGGRHGGVPTEWRYAEILSCYSAYMDADAPSLNAMANASLFQHFPLAMAYPQGSHPTEAVLRAKGDLDSQGHVVSKNYAAIYAGDYDSSAWLYERMPDLWDDPARGSVPLGWAFNPTLDARFPVGLARARATATPNDTFITGDSGAGYLNPGSLVPPRRFSGLPSGLAAWEEHSRRAYARWDLTVTGFIIDGDAPPMSEAVKEAYARFSPGGVVAQKIPEQSLVNGVPFLRMGADLPNPEQGAQVIAWAFPENVDGPHFHIFRTILWSPSSHKTMFDTVRRTRPDIEFVDPNTLFFLLKRSLTESEADR